MTLLPTLADLHAWRSSRTGKVVFVPTMGALHEGHLQLMREGRAIAGPDGQVIVSIFVNPLQFGPKEDFSRYPRELEADMARCATVGMDAIFAPEAVEMYAPDRSVMVLETSLSQGLCGASRPGHFDGVGTVVLKLFNLVQPHTAVFGKKDYQQLAIIRRVVRDLNVPVQIVGSETVREADGLAMSSRNRYLTPVQRAQAPAIRRALLHVQGLWRNGEVRAEALLGTYRDQVHLHAPDAVVDYAACVDRETLAPMETAGNRSLLATAVFFDRTRLIDNLELEPGAE